MDRATADPMAPDNQAAASVFTVGAYRVDVPKRYIVGEGRDVRVEPKVMDVLLCLAAKPGEVVTKDAFMAEVWEGTIVSDDALLRCISELRKAFDDDAQNPDYIETIRARGYRLIAPVRREAPASRPEASRGASSERAGNAAGRSGAGSTQLTATSTSWKNWALALVVVAFVAAAALSWSPRSSDAPAEPLRAVPLTSLKGEEVDPALSPDGGRVVFAHRGHADAPFNLYVKEEGREQPRRLTDSPFNERRPAFSPDGRRVAFVRESTSETSIHVVSIGGAPPSRVKTLQARDVQALAWSPDGGSLVFSAHEAPYEPFGLFLFSLGTLEVRKLTTPAADARGDFAPRFSPDGQTLAFVRSPVSRIADVFAVPVAGGPVRRLTHDNADVTGLDWTPGGREVVFTSDRAGGYGLWQVDNGGGTPRWVATTRSGALHQPATSHTRRSMVYVRRSDEVNIWSVSLAASDTTAALPVVASTRHDTDPDLSPEGQRLAFVSDRSGSDQLWVADLSTGLSSRLTDFEGHVTTSPRWSPEGRRIAFDTRQEGSADIYVVGAGGGTPRRLTPSTSNDKVPRWSRDGQWIYFASNRSGRWEVWKTAANGGREATQITTDGGFAAQEGSGGAYLYYTKRNASGLWRRPLDEDDQSTGEQKVMENLEPQNWSGWTVRGDSVYYVRDGAAPRLMRRALSGGAADVVASLEQAAKRSGFTLSADARRVLYARKDRVESDLMFVELF